MITEANAGKQAMSKVQESRLTATPLAPAAVLPPRLVSNPEMQQTAHGACLVHVGVGAALRQLLWGDEVWQALSRSHQHAVGHDVAASQQGAHGHACIQDGPTLESAIG